MKGEIWKDIEGYEGLYQVSNLGRVKSLNYHRTGKERIMKPQKTNWGYLFVGLCKDGKVKQPLVHRLVGQAFIENPNNLPCINHKDVNPENNCVENLEWCSYEYNNTYNGRAKKVAEKQSKPVFSVNKESGLIMWWESAREAGRVLGISQSDIGKCCKGKAKSCGNYTWFYADDDTE